MSEDVKRLGKPKKKVVAKVLVEEGLSLREAASVLGLSKDTIARYAKEEVPDKLGQFETRIKEAFGVKEQVVAAKALARIDERIATAKISEALEVYKTMMGKGQDKGPVVPIQINNLINEDRERFK